jgi:endoribonuclease Dicer
MAEYLEEGSDPRLYQQQILAFAKERNAIAFLDTGTGKTLISLLLAQHVGQRSVFLAPTKVLAEQQARAARKRGINSQLFVGESYDSWGQKHWQKVMSQLEMMVFTPQLFLNALRNGYLHLEEFQLLIIDECHHCSGDSPYLCIMREFYASASPKPKVFGMTASPIIKKRSDESQLRDDLEKLCYYLDCAVCPVDRASVDRAANKPQVTLHEFMSEQLSFNGESYLERFEDITPMPSSVPSAVHQDPSVSQPFRDLDEELITVRSHVTEPGGTLYTLLGNCGLSLYLRDMASQVTSPQLQRRLRQVATGDISQTSRRFDKLVSILKDHFSQDNKKSKAIVFVQRRVTAWYLAEMLCMVNELAEMELEFGKLIGYSANAQTLGGIQMSISQQRESVRRFKFGEINVMIATSIAEEGLDIPACDLVVRFDNVSNNLRSYVQSKGRARQKDSKFIMLVPRELREETKDEIRDFESAILFLKELSDSDIVSSSASLEAEPGYQVESTGAKVCLSYSYKFLKEVCKRIPADEYTVYEPKVSYSGNYCFIDLPKPLQTGDRARSRGIDNVKEARLDAALKAVENLHRAGLLTDYLKPIWRKEKADYADLADFDTDLVFSEEFGPSVSASIKSGNPTTSFLPQEMTLYGIEGFPDSEYYLYRLDTQPTWPSSPRFKLGLLTPKQLHVRPIRVLPANIFRFNGLDLCFGAHKVIDNFEPEHCRACNSHAVWVTPELVSQTHYSRTELAQLKAFHYLIFSSIRKTRFALYEAIKEQVYKFGGLLNPDDSDFKMPLCVVPCEAEGEIDWGVVGCTADFFRADFEGRLSEVNCAQGEDHEAYQGLVNTVVEIGRSRGLLIPVGVESFGLEAEFDRHWELQNVQEYFASKYSLHLQPQSVLYAKQVGSFRAALRPSVSKTAVLQRTVLVPPQICRPFPIPAELVIWTRLVPSVIHRLQQFDQVSSVSDMFGLDFALTQRALTCTSACDGFDYQRLEFLGDTVLKFLASFRLFHSLPAAHEGILTTERSKLSSNFNLMKVALKNKLYLSMQTTALNSRRWVPPGFKAEHICTRHYTDSDSDSDSDEEQIYPTYIYEEVLRQEDEAFICSRTETVQISHKQLADVVESLIGAAYLTDGFPKANELLAKFGIFDGAPLKGLDPVSDSKDFSSLHSGLLDSTPNIGWVVEAFWHPSANRQRNYQRLEFLGDALLDMIVVSELYKKHPNASPGDLSFMKQQAVNNRTLAMLSYKLRLHDWLVHENSKLGLALQHFITAAEEVKEGDLHKITTLPEGGTKVMADIFESFVGALMLTKGLPEAKAFSLRALEGVLERLRPRDKTNDHPHTKLFELVQKYRLGVCNIKRTILDRNRTSGTCKCSAQVTLNHRLIAEAIGETKFKASSDACELAERELRKIIVRLGKG